MSRRFLLSKSIKGLWESRIMTNQNMQHEDVQSYKDLLENLRSRLNVLNTSIFLLEENMPDSGFRTNKYLKQINREIFRIREMLIELPEDKSSEA